MFNTRIHKGQNYEIIECIGCNIFLIENVFSDEICKKYIKCINQSLQHDILLGPTNNVQCTNIIENEYNKDIFQEIKETFEKIGYDMQKIFEIPIYALSGVQIRKVYGETRLHKDGACPDILQHPTGGYNIKITRSLTMVGTLNDDCSGGIYSFPIQNLNIKVKQGSVLLFPPFWTHPHCVSSIKNGQFRYIVSAWACDNFII